MNRYHYHEPVREEDVTHPECGQCGARNESVGHVHYQEDGEPYQYVECPFAGRTYQGGSSCSGSDLCADCCDAETV